MYLSYGTQPNIVLVVRQLSKQNADPTVRHLKTVKRIVWYLKDTIYLGLTYGAHPNPKEEEKAKAKALVSQSIFDLIGYADSNYAGDPEDRK